MGKMIDVYNKCVDRYLDDSAKNKTIKAEDYIETDETKIKWVQNLIRDLGKGIKHSFVSNDVRIKYVSAILQAKSLL